MRKKGVKRPYGGDLVGSGVIARSETTKQSLLTNEQIAHVIKLLKIAMRDLPDPSVTLVGKKYKSPFLVLISCLLSLRTRDETTLPASERLFARADTMQGMLKIPVVEIEKLIYPVGFYKTKALRIHGICEDLIHLFGARVPDDLDLLLTLKGVGRKTANLVLTEGLASRGYVLIPMCIAFPIVWGISIPRLLMKRNLL